MWRCSTVEVGCPTALLPTCDGLMWCCPAGMSGGDGRYCHVDKAVDMGFYGEIEEDGHVIHVRWDFLGYWEESVKGGIVREGKG